MYKQVLDPVGDSLFLSSLFALIPIVKPVFAHYRELVATDYPHLAV